MKIAILTNLNWNLDVFGYFVQIELQNYTSLPILKQILAKIVILLTILPFLPPKVRGRTFFELSQLLTLTFDLRTICAHFWFDILVDNMLLYHPWRFQIVLATNKDFKGGGPARPPPVYLTPK